ncbi:hypothetical protein [Stenotrophomonas muris]|uniref:hypothetical protein n=1 Tax=Stenotrophomonas muris TaxID=2963283 RepID=UPI00405587CE
MNELTADAIERLKALARRVTIRDRQEEDDDVCIDDFAGGNLDGAYEHGLLDGEVEMARDILRELGVEW